MQQKASSTNWAARFARSQPGFASLLLPFLIFLVIYLFSLSFHRNNIGCVDRRWIPFLGARFSSFVFFFFTRWGNFCLFGRIEALGVLGSWASSQLDQELEILRSSAGRCTACRLLHKFPGSDTGTTMRQGVFQRKLPLLTSQSPKMWGLLMFQL